LRRRWITLSVALLVAALAVGQAGAADKIGYISSERVRFEYKGTRDIQSQLEESVSDWRNQAVERENEIERLVLELQSQELMLSEEGAAEKRRVIETKQLEYEAFVNEIWGVNGLAAQREVELWQPVFDKINIILEEIGKSGDFTMIFDSARMGIVYAAPTTDLTDQVLERLNEEYE